MKRHALMRSVLPMHVEDGEDVLEFPMRAPSPVSYPSVWWNSRVWSVVASVWWRVASVGATVSFY